MTLLRLRLLTLSCAVLLVASAVPAAATTPRATPPPTGGGSQPCPANARELYERVSPAVVSITARSINPYDVTQPVERVAGSGVIIEATGLILTNSHVVYGRQAITVTLDDGTSLPAKIVGADPIFDLAIVQVTPPRSAMLPVANLGHSDDVSVGDPVYAIGNPLGLDQTLTHGLVSAVNRILPDVQFSVSEPLIQTDAPINPGNSGGPLVDACGDVIGVTTLILAEAQNIGFAIPVDLIRQVLPSLESHGRVIRPWFGVQGQLVTESLKQLLRVPLVDGFLVETVEPGSPAARAGLVGGSLDLAVDGQPVLLGGDIVTSIDGEPVNTPESLGAALQKLQVGARITLTVMHEGTARQVVCVLPERPVLPGDVPGDSDLAAFDAHERGPAGRRTAGVARRRF